MKSIELKGSLREGFGKKESKQFRREGLVPAVIYGNGDPVHFTVVEKEMKPLIFTPNSYIVKIDLGDKKETAVMREIQYHPVRDNMLHIDFYRVAEGKPVTIEVPIKVVGNSEGVKLGGKLSISKRKLAVSATLDKLPDTLEVDITKLGLGKSISVGELNYDGITIVTPATTVVCAVNMTRAARGAAAAAEGK